AESLNNCRAATKYGVTECNVRRWRAQKLLTFQRHVINLRKTHKKSDDDSEMTAMQKIC
ncbi:Hypothetical protein FKW44_015177, partial [Caligus rogercresseyi]